MFTNAFTTFTRSFTIRDLYEIFERDPVKYQLYEDAIEAA